MKVNVKRIHSRLEEIYQCGKEEDGTFTRMAYSPEDVKGRETFMNYFGSLALSQEWTRPEISMQDWKGRSGAPRDSDRIPPGYSTGRRKV